MFDRVLQITWNIMDPALLVLEISESPVLWRSGLGNWFITECCWLSWIFAPSVYMISYSDYNFLYGGKIPTS